LAEKLRTGPGIFDGWTGRIREPWHDPNWNPIAHLASPFQSSFFNVLKLFLGQGLRLAQGLGSRKLFFQLFQDRELEQTEPQLEEEGPSAKAPKVSTAEEHVPFNFSVYKAESRPIPHRLGEPVSVELLQCTEVVPRSGASARTRPWLAQVLRRPRFPQRKNMSLSTSPSTKQKAGPYRSSRS
jgi:hypothetical protein